MPYIAYSFRIDMDKGDCNPVDCADDGTDCICVVCTAAFLACVAIAFHALYGIRVADTLCVRIVAAMGGTYPVGLSRGARADETDHVPRNVVQFCDYAIAVINAQ